ncbi:MaoC family dehydratase [Alteromonadaceae bacterium M269]|nr:MaoC family dehydratase [Alteromonadaceae bacterium M269]
MTNEVQNLEVGDTLPVSEWVDITQKKIDAFAAATNDFNWIHVDAEKCAKESPFKTTIAHGFLSATLMPALFYDIVNINFDTHTLLNYGVDSIRFIEPVREGDQIRYKSTLAEREVKPSGTLLKFDCTVEINGREKPAMIGRYLLLLVDR